jgi:hypothetical protein
VVSRLDIEALVTLVQGSPLTDEQDEALDQQVEDLSTLDRGAVPLGMVIDRVCGVLEGDNSELESPAQPAPAVRASARQLGVVAPVVRSDASWLGEGGRKKAARKLSAVLCNTTDVDRATAIGDAELDDAYRQFTQLLGNSPNTLYRDWNTRHTVLQALNALQGQDTEKVYTGIRTRVGYAMYLEILESLSHSNQRKVTMAAIATEWNHRVSERVSAATSAKERDEIEWELGYKGLKDVRDHHDRLDLRMVQVAQAGTMKVPLTELYSDLKALRPDVPERLKDNSVSNSEVVGVSGPRAAPAAASARHPVTAATQIEDEGVDAANVCYLCHSVLGRTLGQSTLRNGEGGWENGHKKAGRGGALTCEHFEQKYSKPAERARLTEQAATQRKRALQKQRRQRRAQVVAVAP